MVEDFKNSISSVFKERFASPFYGAFIISWCVWNWKIIYLTLFISENKIKETKIQFILDHFLDINHGLWMPLVSTLILLIIVPFIANLFYWSSDWFERIRTNISHKIKKSQILTLEQSIHLRDEMFESGKRYTELLNQKEKEINDIRHENIAALAMMNSEQKNKHDIYKFSLEGWMRAAANEFFNININKKEFKEAYPKIRDAQLDQLDFRSKNILAEYNLIQSIDNITWTDKGNIFKEYAFDNDIITDPNSLKK